MGKADWTGPWSDGSKEWTSEWMDALPKLGHVWGDTGNFVMECKWVLLLCFATVVEASAGQTKTSLIPGIKLTKLDSLIPPGRWSPNGCESRGDPSHVHGDSVTYAVSFTPENPLIS